MKNTQGQFFNLPLRCIWCIRSRCHSFMHCYRCKNSASAFPPQLPLLHICDPAGVCGKELPQCCLSPRPKVLKNLKGVKLGWQKTCGAVVRLLFLLSFSPFTTTLTISFFVFFLTNTYNKKIKVIIFAP